MKTLPLPGFNGELPKRVKLIFKATAVIAVGLFVYYISVVNPLFGRAAPPSVSSQAATSINQNTATFNGSISSNGNKTLTDKGFEYGTSTSYGSQLSAGTSSDYEYSATIPYGYSDGQIPGGVTGFAHDSNNNTYVSSTSGNGAITEFDSNGDYVRKWEYFQVALDEFGDPINDSFGSVQGVAIDSNDNMYVLDSGNHRVVKFNSNGDYVLEWGSLGTGSSQMNSPLDITTDASNNVYVADGQGTYFDTSANNRILKFSSTGSPLQVIGTPQGFNFDSGELYGDITGIAVDASGNIYATSFYAGRVQKYNSAGSYLGHIGNTIYPGDPVSDGDIRSNAVISVSLDSSGNIYVSDGALARVQKFASNGAFLTKFGQEGSGNSEFTDLQNIHVDKEGQIFVSDFIIAGAKKFIYAGQQGTYSFNATGLICGTTYHYRAFATNSDGTDHGADQTLTTADCDVVAPDVTTNAADTITRVSASLKGTDATFNLGVTTTRGFQYGTTTSYGTTVNDISSTGNDFESTISGLSCNKVYHFRAYSANSAGTDYGNDKILITNACPGDPPSVTTDNSDNISPTSATLKGTVTDQGSEDLIRRGFEYGTTSNYGNQVSEDLLTTQYAYAGKIGAQQSASSVTVDDSGNMYVAENYLSTNKIYKYNSSGTLVTDWDGSATPSGSFSNGLKLATDGTKLYVSDRNKNRIVVYDVNGSYLQTWTTFNPGGLTLDSPGAMAISNDKNHLYVADKQNGRIIKLNTDGSVSTQWSLDIPSPGNVNLPMFIRVDPNDNVIVSSKLFQNLGDTNYDLKLQKFTKDGEFVTNWSGALDSYLSAVGYEYVNEDNVGQFLVDKRGNLIIGNKFITADAQNSYTRNNFSFMTNTTDSFIDGDGSIYVTRYFNDITNTQGTYKYVRTDTQLGYFENLITDLTCDTTYHFRAFAENSYGVNVQGDDLTLRTSDCGTSPTVVTNDPTGVAQYSATMNGDVTSEGTADITSRGFEYGTTNSYGTTITNTFNKELAYSGKFNMQTYSNNGQTKPKDGIAVDSSGNTYVISENNYRLEKYNSSGAFQTSWGTGQLDSNTKLAGVAVDTNNNIFVSDSQNNKIFRIDNGGTITSWGSYGTGNGNLKNPGALATDGSGNVYVLDKDNERGQKFSNSGSFVATFGTSGISKLSQGLDLVVSSTGDVYANVLSSPTNKIIRFDSNLNYISSWNDDNDGYLAINSQDQLYTTNGNSITKYSYNGVNILSTSIIDQVGSFNGNINPAYIEIDSIGNMYVRDISTSKIVKFSIIDDSGAFSRSLSSLSCNTTYHYRAFSDSIFGTGYGVDKTFTTTPCPIPPIEITTLVTKDGQETSAIFTGSVADFADRSITERGFEYGTTDSYGSSASISSDPGTDDYQLLVEGLSCGTTYHYRASATNYFETAHGEDATFSTDACTQVPTVTTGDESDVTNAGATLPGEITDRGNGGITAKGIRYGTTESYGSSLSDPVSPATYLGRFSSINSSGPIAIDSNGNIFSYNSETFTITKYDSSGNELTNWGSEGTGQSQFIGVKSIAIDSNDNVFVSDPCALISCQGKSRIQKFQNDGNYVSEFITPTISISCPGFTKEASQIAIDKDDNIYAAVNYSIQKINSSDGSKLEEWGGCGYGNGQFMDARSIATDSSGYVYIVDGLINRVQKFASDGEYLDQWGTNGDGQAQLNSPNGIAVDSKGDILVTDGDNGRIQRFSNSGVYLGEWDETYSNGATQFYFSNPFSIVIDNDNNVNVLDGSQGLIKYIVDDQVGNFEEIVDSLNCGTTYHYQAFASNVDGTGYGADKTFQTDACQDPPIVTTQPASSITKTGGNLNGTVVSQGSSSLSQQGFEYGTSSSLGSSTNYTPTGVGAFTKALSNLSCGNTYHFRAFATNTSGTGRGVIRTFTPQCPNLPVVVTNPATSIGKTSGTMNGAVNSDGGSVLAARGFQYGTSSNFGTNLNQTQVALGSFAEALKSLKCGTTYQFRAFATNQVGTAYGVSRDFKTGICELPPEIVITAPENRQVFGSDETQVDLASRAFSPTNKIAKVDFFVDGKYVGTVTQAPYNLRALGLSVGEHTLVTRATDILGVTADALPVTFYVEPPVQPTQDVPSNNSGNYRPVGAPRQTFAATPWLDLPFGHKIFTLFPWILILILLALAISYARQAYKEYQLRNQILQSIEKYQTVMGATNDYLAITSHYLNTPLSIMNGAVELIESVKTAPAAAISFAKTKLGELNQTIQGIISNNQNVPAKVEIDPILKPGIKDALKDKAVWMPVAAVGVCVLLIDILIVRSDILKNASGLTFIHMAIVLLFLGILAMLKRFKAINKAEQTLEKKRLDAQGRLFEKRRDFVFQTKEAIDKNITDLEQASQRLKGADQVNLFNNGLAMIKKLSNGLGFIYSATDTSKEAPILALPSFVKKVADDYKTQANDSKVAINVSVSGKPATRMNGPEAQYLIGSLIENGLKFTKPGGQVDVRVANKGSKVVITVADTGVGIPKERLAQLFQPFARGGDTMQYNFEGAGLGLYIDKVITARYGGSIKMDSVEGAGTTVTITLPGVNKKDAMIAPDLITPSIPTSAPTVIG